MVVQPGGDVDPLRTDLFSIGRVDVPALYEAHWPYLVRLAVLLVDDRHSAEDVVQDAFVALHRKADGLRDPDAALGYLRTSVVNLSRSVIRRRQVARKHLKVAEPEATAGADHDVLLRDEHRAALAAVRALPATAERGARAALLGRAVRARDRADARHLERVGEVGGQPRHGHPAAIGSEVTDVNDDELERLLGGAFDAKARAAVPDGTAPPAMRSARRTAARTGTAGRRATRGGSRRCRCGRGRRSSSPARCSPISAVRLDQRPAPSPGRPARTPRRRRRRTRHSTSSAPTARRRTPRRRSRRSRCTCR